MPADSVRALAIPPAAGQVLLSVVAPAFNEQEVLRVFHERVARVLDGVAGPCELVLVDDGSTDATLAVLLELKRTDPRIAVVSLSRNFGKEIAISAGLEHARGDAVVLIDVDLQDPPELIPQMLSIWQEGVDVVYGQRVEREGESWLKKATAYAFYRFIRRVSRVHIPEDTGDFRLMSRRAVEALKLCREQHRFMKGLFAWIGYPQRALHYRRDARAAGRTKFNYWKLWNFAIEGITSFTTAPLKIATYVGSLTALGAFGYLVVIVAKTLLYGESVRGYPSLMAVVLFLGGIQLITMGVIGEYLGRMFDETKGRPLYLVKTYEPAVTGPATTQPSSVAPRRVASGAGAMLETTVANQEPASLSWPNRIP